MGKPIIYQVLPRLWGNLNDNPVKGGSIEENGSGRFADIDKESLEYWKGLGVSHVWYTGVIRHATRCASRGCSPSSSAWVKGEAGSPYSITDWFDVNPYLASDPARRMEEFEALVERTHEAGLKVLLDYIPNHVARDYGSFSPKPFKDGRDALGHPVFGMEDDTSVSWKEENDFFYYPGEALRLPCGDGSYSEFPAKASGNCFSPAPGINDWFDTVKLNYCDYHTATWDKMYEVVRFWALKGIDGLRCDMVELVPAAFFTWLIGRIKEEFPDFIFVAEVYQKNLYVKYVREVGFDWLYDKSGMYDAIVDIVHKNVFDNGMPVEEWQSARRLTWNWQFLGDIQPHMLNFLENHDEQRYASGFLAGDSHKSMAALHASLLLNTAPFMIYFGEEVGEEGMDEEGLSGLNGRTTIFDWWSPSSVRELYREIHGEKGALAPARREFLARFSSLVAFAAKNGAIGRGDMYDLCYCNYASDGFNKDKHFAFLRDWEEETLLVVCNFSANDARISISIPAHAFDWLGMEKTDELNPSTPVEVDVKAFDGTVMQLCPFRKKLK